MQTVRRYFPVLDSTNEEAKRRILAGDASHGLTIVAGCQEKGRGRQGREWNSPEGNLFYSLVMLPDAPAERMAELVFVAGLAVADALAVADVKLKWPNDILLNGKKVGGLLLETVHKGMKPAVVIGIGINVLHFPENAMYPATSLAAEKVALSLTELEERLANLLPKRYENWRKEGFSQTLAAWQEKGPSKAERIHFQSGGERVSGTFEGLSESGALKLKTDVGEIKEFWIGDVISD